MSHRSRPVRLQPLVRSRVASLGAAGQAWVDGLPQVLAELERTWGIEIGRSLPGGSGSYVARVRRADGRPAVLKVAALTDQFARQAATLEQAHGRGYARLYAVDLSRQALLLESLGGPLGSSGRTPEDQLRILADTLRIAWQDAGEERPGPERDKALGLHELIRTHWAGLGQPCSSPVVEQALRYALELAAAPAEALVVVHGDPHPINALAVPTHRAGAETGYCFVDPDGFVADRAYDLGVALRDWSGQLGGSDARTVAERYCRVLADRSGEDADRIWRWGFVERVSTGLYVLALGAEAVGRPYLESAERLVD